MLVYARNKHANAIDLENGSVMAQAVVEDTFFAATVEIVVSIPEMEIISVEGGIRRAFNEECEGVAIPLLQRVIGLSIATGLIRSVNGLVGGAQGCPRLADLVLECCDQVVLRFTADPIRKLLSGSAQGRTDVFKDFVGGNPRLVGSCIAFAKGSPLLEGVQA